jgi:transposase
MAYFVGLDVSVKETAVCVVDETGKVVCEQKVPSEPDDIVTLLTSIGEDYGRVGIEAGPLSQWLVNGMAEAGLPVICVETRHIKSLLKAQQINKSDRHDARGIAQMMRVGLFKPVHVKTLASQEKRMLLTARKLVQRKMLDVDADLRGTLRNFGLKVGVVGLRLSYPIMGRPQRRPRREARAPCGTTSCQAVKPDPVRAPLAGVLRSPAMSPLGGR